MSDSLPARVRLPSASAASSPLRGAHIVVGVGGGIAAYKAAELVRLLVKAGATVSVAMTANAQEFVGATTFAALSGRPVFTDMLNPVQENTIGHIQLADQADLIIIAPATANLLARLAAGQADDVVTALALATKAPVLVAPAMNVNMWQHPLTQANLARLQTLAGYHVVAPGEGELACGWTGAGRLAEPAEIVEAALTLRSPQDLAGRRVVISAGPTYEPLDPARFIGNRSTGKMGIALAQAAARRGADVTLVLGQVAVPVPVLARLQVMHVQTALQMQRALQVALANAEGGGAAVDALIMTAAVADFRPSQFHADKLKRATLGQTMQLALTQNPDVLAGLTAPEAAHLRPRLVVGFAAETTDVVAHATRKLHAKRCDMIVANDVSAPDAGFGVDTNRVALIDASGVHHVPLGSKLDVSHALWDVWSQRLRHPASATSAPGVETFPAVAGPKAGPRSPGTRAARPTPVARTQRTTQARRGAAQRPNRSARSRQGNG